MADEQPEVVIRDGAGTEHVFPAGFDPQRAAQIVREGAGAAPVEKSGTPVGTATAVTTGLKTGLVPAVQGTARIVADHPRAAQQAINTVSRAATGAIGAEIGGVPGAVVGASLHGLTPTQGTLRTVAGEIAGETPQAASAAGRAQAIINYAREQGVKLASSHVIPSTENPALDNYAASQGSKILRLYAPTGPAGTPGAGVQVVGPMTPTDAPTSMIAKALPKVARGLGYLNAATGVTDLAQMAEPKRQDIGIMGIGRSVPHDDAHPAVLNALGTKTLNGVAALRAALLARMGHPEHTP